MDDPVAHTSKLYPRDCRMSRPEFGRKLFCCLSDYLEVAHDRIDSLFVSEKQAFVQAGGVTLYFFNGSPDIVEQNTGLPPSPSSFATLRRDNRLRRARRV